MGLLLHLFTLGAPAHDATVDAAVRDEVVPRLLAAPRIRAVFVGRHGDTGRRVIASVSDDSPPPDPDLDRSVVQMFAERDELPDVDVTVAPVAVAVYPDGTTPPEPRVIRLFHGRVRAGELPTYLDEVQAGATADLRDGGLVALYVAVPEQDRFVTLSVWSDWEAISRATGGDLHEPSRTRHAERLEQWSADHYEALPG